MSLSPYDILRITLLGRRQEIGLTPQTASRINEATVDTRRGTNLLKCIPPALAVTATVASAHLRSLLPPIHQSTNPPIPSRFAQGNKRTSSWTLLGMGVTVKAMTADGAIPHGHALSKTGYNDAHSSPALSIPLLLLAVMSLPSSHHVPTHTYEKDTMGHTKGET